MNSQILVGGVGRIVVSTEDVHQVRRGYPVYRAITRFEDNSKPRKLIKEYWIWLTEDFTADHLRIKNGKPSINNYAVTAMEQAFKRFTDNEDEVPSEEGLDCSNKYGILTIPDAKNYVHPVERL